METSNWDSFIKRSDVIAVDTRNSYEIKPVLSKGFFFDPHTESFREFPQWAKNNTELFKKKKIAMFCTGGIRCENLLLT